MKGKEYIRPIKATWWLHNRHLTLFMLREVTSLFVLGYAIFLIYLLHQSNNTRTVFHDFFQSVLLCKWCIAFQLIALVFVLYHTVTTIHAAPVLMVIQRGEERVSPQLIILGNYLAWLAATLAIIWWATR